MDYKTVLDAIGLFLSSFGAAIILLGAIRAIIKFLENEISRLGLDLNEIRMDFTSKIMLGLEFFIAGDLMRSIITPTLNETITLAIIVAIRTVIGYSISSREADTRHP